MDNRACKQCNVWQPIDCFHGYLHSNGRRYWAHVCKECKKPAARERKKKWYASDPDRARSDSRTWYEQNKERTAAAVMQYRVDRAEWFAKYHKEWRQKNKAKILAWCRKYQTAKLNAVPPWACGKSISAIYQKARAEVQEVDHIVPLRHPLVCGLHVQHNLQLLPPDVNNAKGNRWWPDMWEPCQ